ncbi:MAG: hypothetical protein QW041_01260 [Candidatus Pacearchaeota archaeon]
MLESILLKTKKAILPLAISSTILSFSNASTPYISIVNLDNKNYRVLFDENNKPHVNAENLEIAKKAAFKALINQKSEELETHVKSLTYESLQTIFGPIERGKEIDNKINTIDKYLGLDEDIPFWIFSVLEYREKFDKKLLADVFEAWKYRNNALKFLKSIEEREDLANTYKNLCIIDENILDMTENIKEKNELTSIKFILDKKHIDFFLDKLLRTWNLEEAKEKIEEIKKELENPAVRELKEDLEKTLEESRDYRKNKEKSKEKEIGKIIRDQDIISETPEKIFQKNFIVPLFTQSNPSFQTFENQEKASLDISIEKYNLKEGCILELIVLSDKVFNKAKTNIFCIHLPETRIGKIGQKAYTFSTRYRQFRQWEEILPYGQDKYILLEMDATKWAFNKMISMTMKGNIIKTKNLLRFIGENIYGVELERDVNKLNDNVIKKLNDAYSVHGIKINPVGAFRQAQGYLFLIPIYNFQKDVILYMNLTMQSGLIPSEKGFGVPSGYEEAEGRLEDLVISVNKKTAFQGFITAEEQQQEKYDKSLINFLENKKNEFEKENPFATYDYEITAYDKNKAEVKVNLTFTRKIGLQEWKNEALSLGTKILNSNPADLGRILEQSNTDLLNSEKKEFHSLKLWLEKQGERWYEKYSTEKDIKRSLEIIRRMINIYYENHKKYPQALKDLREDFNEKSPEVLELCEIGSRTFVRESELIYDKNNGKIYYKPFLKW